MATHSYSILIEEAYQQTLGLLIEARDFAACRMVLGDGEMPPADRLVITAEQYRLTSRLASILAWLMSRKAVDNGHARETDEIVDLARLDCKAPWQGDWRAPSIELPGELENLLQRCRLLHDRMTRLFELLHQPAVAASQWTTWAPGAHGPCRRESDRRSSPPGQTLAMDRRSPDHNRRGE